MKYKYFLPKKNFFKRGYRGSVIHALGIINGFENNSIETEVIHYGGLDNFLPTQRDLQFKNFINSIIKLIKLVRNPNRILIRYSISNGPLLLLLLFFSKNKHSICLEVNTVTKMYRKRGVTVFLSHMFEKLFLKKFKLIYVVSNNAKIFLINKLNIPKENIIVLPNALIHRESDKIDFTFQTKKNDPIRLVYFGSLHHYYDIPKICDWLQFYNMKFKCHIQLHIYGNDDSNDAEKLKKQYTNLIVFHGTYDNNSIKKLIQPNDILILPYKSGTIAEYGSPTKLFEYMSLGCPILASNVGQVGDILTHKKNSVIYNSQKGFNEGLLLLVNDFNLRKKIAESALEEVFKSHTWRVRINELVGFWNSRFE